MVGLKYPKVEANIITISHDHPDHNQKDQVAGSPFIIDAPGEYEISEISLFGIATFHDSMEGRERGKNIIFLIEADGLKLCHLGDLGHKLSDKQLEELNEVDILFIPIGGTGRLG